MQSPSFLSFSNWLIDQGKAMGTIKTYIEVMIRFKHWLETQGFSLEQLTQEHIQKYIQYLENDKSSSTVEKHFAAINMYSKFNYKPQLMVGVIRQQNHSKQKKLKIPDTLELAEEKLLLNNVIKDGNLRNISMVYLFLHTGIRVSELCNLNINDISIHSDQPQITIYNQLGKIDRNVPLSKEAKNHLSAYLETLFTHRNGPVFTSQLNSRITPRAVQYILKKYGVTPHKLRHTFCFRLINSGVDIRSVSKLAGHKDLNVTKRYIKDKDVNLLVAIDNAFAN